RDDDAARLVDCGLDDLVEGIAGVDAAVPPNRPARALQHRRELLDALAVVPRIADEEVCHPRYCCRSGAAPSGRVSHNAAPGSPAVPAAGFGGIGRKAGGAPLKPTVDPITVSVIQHRLLAIVEEMGEAMLRTSYSQILNSSRDFSTGICDLEGRLIAQPEHVPIHVGALPWAARSVTDFFRGDIHPGDVFLLNDPYHGGNHLPDLTAFVPVFDGAKPIYWSINRAHQSDIGGATHGAYNAGATEIWQE